MKTFINLLLATICCSMLQAEIFEENTSSLKIPQGEVQVGEHVWKINWSGQVNMGVLVADDGADSDQHGENIFLVENDSAPTKICLHAYNEYNDDLSLGGNIQGISKENSSMNATQDGLGPDASEYYVGNIFELYFNSKKYGKVLLGKGPTSIDGSGEMDYSGTELVSTSGSYHTNGGLRFRDENDSKELSRVVVRNVFSNFDNQYNRDRLRYNTPKVYGYEASVSFIEGNHWDLGVNKDFDSIFGVKSKAGLSYAHNRHDSNNPFNQIIGSVAFLHEETGLNLALAAGTKNMEDTSNTPHYYYTKLGLIEDYFECGSTSMSIDFYKGKEFNSKEGRSSANTFGVVQNVDSINTDFYFNTSLHKFKDKTDVRYKKILSAIVGVRIYFS